MRKFPSFVLAAFLVSFTGFSGCSGSGSGSATDPGVAFGTSGVWDTTVTLSARLLGSNYLVVSDPFAVYAYCGTLPGSVDTSGEYISGAPVLDYDTSVARNDTSYYKVLGNTLLTSENDTETLGGGTRVVNWTVSTRSSGAGVQGTWSGSLAESLEVVGVSYPSDSIDKLRAQNRERTAALLSAGTNLQLTITSNSLSEHIHYGSYAQLMVAEMTIGSIEYDSIAIQVTSPTTIVYTGKRTKEVVTETFLSKASMQYSSSDPTHATYTDNESPISVSQCPENDWFWTFISANQASTSAARTVNHATPTTVRRNPSRHFGLLPNSVKAASGFGAKRPGPLAV
jgi:hypothetical protein